MSIDLDSFKSHLKRYVTEKSTEGTGPVLKNKATAGKLKRLYNMTRADEVTSHQLRKGKTPLVAHCLAKYKGMTKEKGYCLEGYKEKETVDQLLTCPIYERQKYLTNMTC